MKTRQGALHCVHFNLAPNHETVQRLDASAPSLPCAALQKYGAQSVDLAPIVM
jgi:hypothetical protein